MIAVWNGEKLTTVDTGPVSKDLFKAVRAALNNGFAEIMNREYARASVTFQGIRDAGVVVFCDEDGLNKKLPVTWQGQNFNLVGPIVFSGYDKDTEEYIPLTPEQLEVVETAMTGVPN